MKARWAAVALAVAGIGLLAACSDDEPSESFTQGAELYTVTFDDAGAWEAGAFPLEAEQPTSFLSIADGRYLIDHQSEDPSFAWGVGGAPYENVVIEVDTQQLSPFKDNLYGVLCRVAPNERGDLTGYALLISGDGHFGIANLEKGPLSSAPFLTFLLEWHQSEHIKQGEASNQLRAVCVDDYLAIYANGKFLGDVRDSAYRRPGQVGLVAGANREGNVIIAFDTLTVFEGTLTD